MQDISEILAQNKWPPKNYSSAYIEGFNHWFLPENINRIDNVLKSIKEETNGEKCLDIGFGNPIVLQRELKIYPQCYGLYIALEKALEKNISKSILYEGNCYKIPFDSEKFDLVSAYALLHIIPDISEFYKEAFRVIKTGGFLYTDGDRNIIITKMIRKVRMIQYRLTGNKVQFNYWREILNPKENFHKEGIDYKVLKKLLQQTGYSKIEITPWFSANPDFDNKFTFRIFKKVIVLFKLNFLFSHIQIIAKK